MHCDLQSSTPAHVVAIIIPLDDDDELDMLVAQLAM
jgi:hypothetical protein